jgi:hypothetical protein
MEHIDKTDSKLWIIGDSFTGMRHENDSWPFILKESFIGRRTYVSSDGSRDIQTIIDIFLKNLHNIKQNDFVILMLPTTARFRLPLENPNVDTQFPDSEEGYYESLFIGNTRYDSIEELIKMKDYSFYDFQIYEQCKLEFPLSELDIDVFRDIVNPKSFTSIIKSINASKASIRNYNEILNSFKNYFPFKIELYSWIDELDETIVQTKKIITNKCGLWHTDWEDFIETNGESGKHGDSHWSKKMDKTFANMVIKENPKYFNQNLI